MDYEMATQVGINQVDMETAEDELQAASLSEFLGTVLVSLAAIVLVSAGLYLAVVTVVALGTSGLHSIWGPGKY